jgi:hypothetical protein
MVLLLYGFLVNSRRPEDITQCPKNPIALRLAAPADQRRQALERLPSADAGALAEGRNGDVGIGDDLRRREKCLVPADVGFGQEGVSKRPLEPGGPIVFARQTVLRSVAALGLFERRPKEGASLVRVGEDSSELPKLGLR